MDQRASVATRKVLFEIRRRWSFWAVARVHFLGEPVSMVLPSQPGLWAGDDGGDRWATAWPRLPPDPCRAFG